PPYLFLYFFHSPPHTFPYTLSLHDALPIYAIHSRCNADAIARADRRHRGGCVRWSARGKLLCRKSGRVRACDRFRWVAIGRVSRSKSTRLNSSHVSISYAVFCLKKKNYSEH